jgi:hypothetical protein
MSYNYETGTSTFNKHYFCFLKYVCTNVSLFYQSNDCKLVAEIFL